MSAGEIKILRWMNKYIRLDRISNNYIRKKVRVVPIDKRKNEINMLHV